MTPREQEIVARGLRAAADLKRYRKLDFFEPYLNQMEFFANGAKSDQRAMIAGNQIGKTKAAQF